MRGRGDVQGAHRPSLRPEVPCTWACLGQERKKRASHWDKTTDLIGTGHFNS